MKLKLECRKKTCSIYFYFNPKNIINESSHKNDTYPYKIAKQKPVIAYYKTFLQYNIFNMPKFKKHF